jgi:excisionase family DNA binding protein
MSVAIVVDKDTLPLMLKAPHIQSITLLSRPKVYDLLNTPGCPVVRFGRTIRVPRDTFLRWLEQQAGVEEV